MKKQNNIELNRLARVIYGDSKNLKLLVADKTFERFDNFISSEELAEVHAGFTSKTIITKKMFVKAWVVGKDVYVKYYADGIFWIRKESIGLSIDNFGLFQCIEFPQGIIIDTSIAYDKGEENRKTWRKQDWKTFISTSEVK